MPPLPDDLSKTLHAWHAEQTPAVHALASPMIAEVTASLGKLQAYLADQGLLDEATVERLKSMPTVIAAMKQ